MHSVFSPSPQDDIIDDVGDFVAAAEILKERGAYKIYIMATHGLLSADAPRLIEESAIDEVSPPQPHFQWLLLLLVVFGAVGGVILNGISLTIRFWFYFLVFKRSGSLGLPLFL